MPVMTDLSSGWLLLTGRAWHAKSRQTRLRQHFLCCRVLTLCQSAVPGLVLAHLLLLLLLLAVFVVVAVK